MKKRILYITLITLAIFAIRCKQNYDPPAIKNPNEFLVVDGFINTAANGITSINLNRTRALTDSTATGIPELRAKIAIQASNGASYPLTDATSTGIYASLPLNLDITQRYTLQITTADGRKYASDPVIGKYTPPVDSVYWSQPGDLNLYVNTHDPAGNSKYYRFDYLETWEHDSEFQTPYAVSNGLIYQIDPVTQQVDRCWTTRQSTDVLLANSTALSQDVINGFQLAIIPNADVRLNKRYSALVRAYALSEDAYNYWQIVQKTSDNTGTLFDLQPSQLISNIHCTSNPSEPVIGFLSATSSQEKRIFIDHHDLNSWPVTDTISGCVPIDTYQNPTNFLIFDWPDTSFGPWYFQSGGGLRLLRKKCMNCLYQGGTSIKPAFWQ